MISSKLIKMSGLGGAVVMAAVTLSVGLATPAASQSGAAAIVSSASGAKLSEGKRLWFQCRACHTLNKGGRHKVGPNMYGFFNKRAGTRPGYRYSKALKNSGIIWNVSALDKWIKKPGSLLKGHKMTYSGMRDARKRAVLIKYIRANSK